MLRPPEPGALDAATPCAGYDLHGLLNHLLYWTPLLTAAARRRPMPEAGGAETGGAEAQVDLVGPGWSGLLDERIADLATALGDPAAWLGETRMTAGELPAAMIGRMALCELLVHGWDLARATGREFEPEADAVAVACGAVAGMAEQARAAGVFGAEVVVSPTAPVLDRALGAAGRDPRWRPAGS